MRDALRISYFASKAAYEESRFPSVGHSAKAKVCSSKDVLILDSVISNSFHGIEVMLYRHAWLTAQPKFGNELEHSETTSIIAAFRGSEFKWNDWFNNFRFLPTARGWHRGWTYGFESVENDFANRLNILKNNIIAKEQHTVPVIGTGHSRGGSFSKIAALMNYYNTCITFGAPAVAERGLARGVNAHYLKGTMPALIKEVPTYVNLANKGDFIPYLTRVVGYGTSSYIKLDIPKEQQGFIKPHRLPAYRASLAMLGVFDDVDGGTI